jgi:hypothetical protein
LILILAQSGFQVAVSFATPFMAWIINFTPLFAWTLVHIGVRGLSIIDHAINGVANDTAT